MCFRLRRQVTAVANPTLNPRALLVQMPASWVTHAQADFLVSIGLSASFYEFDPAKDEALARLIEGPA